MKSTAGGVDFEEFLRKVFSALEKYIKEQDIFLSEEINSNFFDKFR